jgi:hypothetical protein
MKMKKRGLTTLLGVLLLLVLSQCSKYKEPAPFFDGLYLEYHGKSSVEKYNITEDGSNFKVNMVQDFSVLRDEKKEFTVNDHGIRKDSGEFSNIWISVKELKIGDSFDGGFLVTRLDTWKEWEVMVVKAPLGRQEIFHEMNTGFLVGWTATSVSGTTELVLVDTNADIPIAK